MTCEVSEPSIDKKMIIYSEYNYTQITGIMRLHTHTHTHPGAHTHANAHMMHHNRKIITKTFKEKLFSYIIVTIILAHILPYHLIR